MTDKINLEGTLAREGFVKVGEGKAKDGKLKLEIRTSSIPGPGSEDIRVLPDDCYLQLRVVDKADLEEGVPAGQEYVVYEKQRERIVVDYYSFKESGDSSELETNDNITAA